MMQNLVRDFCYQCFGFFQIRSFLRSGIQIVRSPRNCAVGITSQISGFLPTTVTLTLEPEVGPRCTTYAYVFLSKHLHTPSSISESATSSLFSGDAPSLFADSSVWQANCVSTGTVVAAAAKKAKTKTA